VLIAFPVYRTYARRRPDGSAHVAPADRLVVDEAIAEVEASKPEIDTELLALLRRILRSSSRATTPRSSASRSNS